MVGVSRVQSRQGWFLRQVRIEPGADNGRYPFTLPAVSRLSRVGGLELPAGVTFLVGENGSGKSTIVEAVAVAAGINPEGGSQNFRFASRSSESTLGERLVLRWGPRKPRTRFFLRAESYYNVATEIERLDEDPGSPPLLPAYGGVSPHERSHGESFLDLVVHRFGRDGLYLLDEPEAALSVRGCLALLARLADLTAQGCQLLIATHSPVLLALPGATILEVGDDGDLRRTEYDDALPVRLTRDFLAHPHIYFAPPRQQRRARRGLGMSSPEGSLGMEVSDEHFMKWQRGNLARATSRWAWRGRRCSAGGCAASALPRRIELRASVAGCVWCLSIPSGLAAIPGPAMSAVGYSPRSPNP